MYAIIKTGGKQYRIMKGDIIDIELVEQEKEIEFKDILLIESDGKTTVGSPNLDKAIVKGKILGMQKGPKVIAFKYRRRKDSKKTVGHRQKYTKVEITEVTLG
jgi:large subunit ribosomal protein L21